nr:hypothetical protein [Actinomycetota bacterium]
TEVLVAEVEEERVEIVIGSDEVVAEIPSEEEAPPEHASPYQDPQWDTEQEQTPVDEPSGDGTQWGRPTVEEAPPAAQQPTSDPAPEPEPPGNAPSGRPPVDESPKDEPSEVAAPTEEQFPADAEIPHEAAPGAPPKGTSQAPPEGQQPDVDERLEDPEDAVSAPPGGQTPQDPQERGQHEEQNLRQDGPRHGQDRRPGAEPTNTAEEVERNDGVGGAVREEAQDLVAGTAENGDATPEEQMADTEEGGSPGGAGVSESSPIPDTEMATLGPPSQAASPTTEEPVAAEPVPQNTSTPARSTAEEPAAQQYDEPSQRASTQQHEPSKPAVAKPAPVPEAAPQRPPVEPETQRRGGEENK